MIRMLKCFIGASLLFFMVACQPAPEPEKPKGILRIATVPSDMPITVNGEPKGNSPSGEGQYFSISLEEGEYKIEILKSIDEEKDLYAEKTLIVAADTIQIVTLEAKEQLTPFGEQAKIRRDAEEAEKAEKKRQAELDAARKEKNRIAKEKKLKAERHIRMVAINSEHASFINEQFIKIGDRNVTTQKFFVSGCNIKSEQQLREDVHTQIMDAEHLRPLVAENFEKSHEYMYKSGLFGIDSYKVETRQIRAKCKENRKCIKRTLLNGRHEFRNDWVLMESVLANEKKLKSIFDKLDKVIDNCQ